MKKSALIALALGAVVILGLLFWLAPDDESAAGIDPATGMPARSDGPSAHQLPATFTTGTESLPGSLQGTEVDGELEVDASGRLKITNGVRRVFDYFLSAIGEEPLESIVARIRAYIRHKLPASAAAEAEQLLDSYLAYKRGLEGMQQGQPGGSTLDLDAIRRQMQQVQALRTQFFKPEVITAFFGDEDVYDRYTLARLEVMQNKSLSPLQRAQQLGGLEDMLPEAMRESIKVINQVQNLDALTQDWKKRGGSPAELRQIRESVVGPEATQRLEALDQEQASWNQRMDAWYKERDTILANTSLSEQDRQKQIVELRKQRFSGAESVRAESLEHMRDRGEVVNR
ncbi:MAG: lipase chaperone [Moraxellaceae bacterium]|jgi:lipase chaperone LimK|nr:lipase chaperone [Moraxellaceae bacterium]